MSKFELKDGQGSLFRNDRKEKPNHPDYTGQAKVGGEEYWLSAWIKESASGQKRFSLSIRKKEAKAEAPAETLQDDRDIPF